MVRKYLLSLILSLLILTGTVPSFAVDTTTGDPVYDGDNITLSGVTVESGVTVSDATASKLIATDANKKLSSTDLNSWVAGTANEVSVADDGDGTITIGIVDPLIVSKGGTGAATLTDGGIVLGSGTNAVTVLGQATDGQIPIGSTSADPVLGTITAVANETNVTNTAGAITIGIVDPLIVDKGGSGVTTLTDGGVLVGSGTNPVTALTVGTNGQVLVGSTGNDPVFATITDGEGIDTTLGAGTLTIAAETATDTNPGVVELAIDSEAIAGTDTSRAITAANLAAKLGTQTDGGILVGSGTTGAVEAVAVGLTTEILVGGGAGTNPVWTTVTGTGAPVRATSPTLVTPLLGTPTSGVVTNLTGTASGVTAGNVTTNANLTGPITSVGNATSIASQTGTGSTFVVSASPTLTGTPLAPTAADNTSTTQIATTAFAKAADAAVVNPKAFAQGIRMTAGTTAGGIAVADNDNIDFGTGNFTFACLVSVPDWTPSSINYLLYKTDHVDTGCYLAVQANGKLRVPLFRGDGGVNFDSTVATSFVDGTKHEITVVVTRETASVAGSVVFYVDGIQLGNSVAITAAAPVSISNTGRFDVFGDGLTAQFAGTAHSAIPYNRALTAAGALSLYRNGVDFFDKYGSQTTLNLATLANSGTSAYDTFDGASTTAFHAITDGSDVARASTTDAISYVSGYKYKVSFTSSGVTGTAPTYGPAKDVDGTALTGGVQTNTVVAGINTYEFTAGETATGTVVWSSILESGVTTEYTISLFSITKLGATLALESEGIQPAPGQWLDGSGNKLHAMQPATGSSLVRFKRDFEVRWTNTWAGTHEAQYIGGVNQAILPVGCYITSIIGVVAGATIEDIIVGDGSDTDHWVAVTTGLAAGTTAFTIANAISDATNYKMVVDPDANFTGTIAWTVRGIILQ
uniref:Lectin/glucanase superfamily protein n=1 Tax=viral metagenome TaxID=1070528 RepID=A0A6M3KXB5_9ZZZZ